MHLELRFRLYHFPKYYISLLYAKRIVKMKAPNTSSVVWHAPVIHVATCGYQGNCRIKVFAVSTKL